MKTLVVVLLMPISIWAQKFSTGEDLLKTMHKKYAKAGCQCFTFSQKNSHYNADTISGHSEWHEKMLYPDYFRITFGDTAKGNFVVFKNDSAYNFKAGKLLKSRADTNSLILILGGMYYRDLRDVIVRLKLADYKTAVISEQSWNNESVYVIGAESEDLTSNQIWISKKDYRVLRLIEKMSDKEWMDMRFEGHQKLCNNFIETKVSFRRNGKLEQVEEYYNIKECNGVRK